ncbi:MAG TPA: phosphotransferase, partial [Hyphomicrobiaceae bacterium]|nr:phosphotransferase [Hyphomicrobiaceae bacterium]
MPAEATPLALAAELARRAGRAAPISTETLSGGKNNRVYRVALADGQSLLLKSYFRDLRDPRDRRKAEWEFLTLAWSRGVRAIPEPIATDVEAGAALMSFVPGRKLAAGEIGAPEVEAALDFVVALNRPTPPVTALAPGSEACFSLGEHL